MFCKNNWQLSPVNYFCKSSMFYWVLNMSLHGTISKSKGKHFLHQVLLNTNLSIWQSLSRKHLCFFYVFKGYRKRPVALNGWIHSFPGSHKAFCYQRKCLFFSLLLCDTSTCMKASKKDLIPLKHKSAKKV